MARHQVEDRRDGLQIWRVTATVLNNQSGRGEQVVVIYLGGLDVGLTTHRKIKINDLLRNNR
jgi:hypothetical protein